MAVLSCFWKVIIYLRAYCRRCCLSSDASALATLHIISCLFLTPASVSLMIGILLLYACLVFHLSFILQFILCMCLCARTIVPSLPGRLAWWGAAAQQEKWTEFKCRCWRGHVQRVHKHFAKVHAYSLVWASFGKYSVPSSRPLVKVLRCWNKWVLCTCHFHAS